MCNPISLNTVYHNFELHDIVELCHYNVYFMLGMSYILSQLFSIRLSVAQLFACRKNVYCVYSRALKLVFIHLFTGGLLVVLIYSAFINT